jgi:hypothetical protein
MKTIQALAYALLIWIAGFVWGSIVFMTPALKSVAAIPYVSKNPAISFPILLIWPFLTYVLARSYLKNVPDKGAAGLRLGLIFSAVNLVLDLVVLVFLLKTGFSYFVSLTVWAGYLMLLIIPWLTGRQAEARASRRA